MLHEPEGRLNGFWGWGWATTDKTGSRGHLGNCVPGYTAAVAFATTASLGCSSYIRNIGFWGWGWGDDHDYDGRTDVRG
jgi:hypothetical protein